MATQRGASCNHYASLFLHFCPVFSVLVRGLTSTPMVTERERERERDREVERGGWAGRERGVGREREGRERER